MTPSNPTHPAACSSHELVSDPLTRSSESAHAHARTMLTGSDAPVMDAVVWLSAHLTAMEHVVYPVMATLLTDHQKDLDRQRAASRRMHRGLRLLEQRCAGDGLIRIDSLGGRPDRLLVMMDEHAARERDLLARLVEALDEQATSSLAVRYDDAVRHGPTRPHPHGPHRGQLGRLTYAFDAVRDHLLDILDSRHVPLPKDAPPQRKVGRWGRYLLGGIDPAPTERVVGPQPMNAPQHRGDDDVEQQLRRPTDA
jgi:hypothetical protein